MVMSETIIIEQKVCHVNIKGRNVSKCKDYSQIHAFCRYFATGKLLRMKKPVLFLILFLGMNMVDKVIFLELGIITMFESISPRVTFGNQVFF